MYQGYVVPGWKGFKNSIRYLIGRNYDNSSFIDKWHCKKILKKSGLKLSYEIVGKIDFNPTKLTHSRGKNYFLTHYYERYFLKDS